MADKKEISPLFDKSWKSEWQDMPEFVQEDQDPFHRIHIHFRSQEDVDAFIELVGQKPKKNIIWYPERPAVKSRYEKIYVDAPMKQKQGRSR